jgi:SAM-dependent methyltransferase
MKRRLVLGGGAAATAGWLYAHRNPSACPYSQRWLLKFPRPFLSPGPVLSVLRPQPGEKVLEIGPGVGYHSFATAEALGPDGTLSIFDLQQEMLDSVMSQAAERGVTNIEPRQGDAMELPYEDGSFDAAFLVTVLGEIPDGDRTLRELRRVLKPGGRAVFGETVLDPHVVFPAALRRRAEEAGFRHDERKGIPPLGWLDRYAAV